jgi:hypothetical protein
VLAREGGRPVLVRDGRILIATFHPELTADTTVHEYFLKLAAEKSSVTESQSGRSASNSSASKSISSEITSARSSPMSRR